MRYYCTHFGQEYLSRGLALHQSLIRHAGPFELVVLCMDETVQSALQDKKRPHLKILPLAALLKEHTSLSSARGDRTPKEFSSTCVSWLLKHLLTEIPAGELLTYLAPDLYFFNAIQPVFDEIGMASVAIVPQRSPQKSVAAQHGEFADSWVSLRYDSNGLACSDHWAAQCAGWCFKVVESDRYCRRKYLDKWPVKFEGVHIIKHAGLCAAPGNIEGRSITSTQSGLQIDAQPLICFHFQGLMHIAHELYDPKLHVPEVCPSTVLRREIYWPYLKEIGAQPRADDESPDIVPPIKANDPRSADAVLELLTRLHDSQRKQDEHWSALEKCRRDSRQIIDDLQAGKTADALYTQEVEQDRNEQRQAFFDTRQKLEAFHLDLVRNVAYLKKLQEEAAVLQQASVDREAYITSINEQMARRDPSGTGRSLADFHGALEPYSRDLRRLLVVQYHPHLLPTILWLAALGVSVEVLGTPTQMAIETNGEVKFWKESLWEWLGGLNSLFDENSYLITNPDVAQAMKNGAVASGWDHFQRFGQYEGRKTGTPHFRSGLTDADALAFDSSDADSLIPCLFGRVQSHHRLFISSSFNPATVWLPAETPRTIVYSDLLSCARPPLNWIGPPRPSAFPAPHRAKFETPVIYPTTPSQQAVWPKISVVTYSRNQGAFLEATIRSVLDQNYPNLEYIVVDGGSTDGSADIIHKYAERLAWSISEKDTGQSRGLNKGFAKSTGEVLSWLNAGDQLAPGSLFFVAQNFLLHDTDMVTGRCALITDSDPQTHHYHRSVLSFGKIQPLPLPALLDLENCWLKDWFFRQPEIFFSRKLYERVGGQLSEDLQYCMDYELWLRFAGAEARILPLPEILAISREGLPLKTSSQDSSYLQELVSVGSAYRKIN